jgi:hypothetical protein
VPEVNLSLVNSTKGLGDQPGADLWASLRADGNCAATALESAGGIDHQPAETFANRHRALLVQHRRAGETRLLETSVRGFYRKLWARSERAGVAGDGQPPQGWVAYTPMNNVAPCNAQVVTFYFDHDITRQQLQLPGDRDV